MFAKMFVAWAAVVLILTVQAESQYDYLGSDIFTIPTDMRKISSMDDFEGMVYLYNDPLGIDPLMRPLDPEHTLEYLDIVSGRKYSMPYALSAIDLRGNWRLELLGGLVGQADIVLLQSQNLVYGRGALTRSGSASTVSASGMTARDVLYLDLVSLEDLTLYKLTLSVSRDTLSGSYEAFDAQGRTASGTAKASRLA